MEKADLLTSPLPCRTPPEVEELWIGLNDLKLQMNFEWSDGSLVSFTHWHPFEPNNFRDSLEDCVTIWGPVRTLSPHSAPRPRLPVPQQLRDVLFLVPACDPTLLPLGSTPTPSRLLPIRVERLPGFDCPLHLQLAGSSWASYFMCLCLGFLS